MPPQRGNPPVTLEQPFPYGGLDESDAFSRQQPGTCAGGENVRVFEPALDRQRGGSRQGTSKYTSSQLNGSNVVQSLDTITLAQAFTGLPGSTLVKGAASDEVVLLAEADGSVSFTTEPLAATNFGCFDSAGYGYIVYVASGFLTVYSIDTNSAAVGERYRTSTTYGSLLAVYGVVAFDGILYVLAGVSGLRNVYRVNPDDGTALDAGAFISLSTSGGGAFLAFVMAITAGAIGLLAVDNSASVVLKQFTLSGGTLAATTTIQSKTATFSVMGGSLTADGAGNFFALGEEDDTSNSGSDSSALKMVDAAGAVIWSQTFDNSGSGFTVSPTGVAYDSANGRLGVVGHAIGGTTDSFQTRSITDGSKIAGSQPNTQATWFYIAADGEGGFRIARQATSSNVAALSSALAVNWTASTGVSPTWIAGTSSADSQVTNLMRSTRVTKLFGVCFGSLLEVTSTGITTVSSSFLAPSADVVFGQAAYGSVYYVDGNSYKVVDATHSVASTWTASNGGTLPVDSRGEKARLIAVWRGRLLLSGLRSDPHNIFMSRIADPLDYDYESANNDGAQAVALNASPQGLLADIVNTLIPWSDDVLFIGGDHSIYVLSGDPAANGQLDLVSDVIGMAWGRPWCKGPDGTLFFFASRGAVYAIVPGQQPVCISQQISDRLLNVNVGTSIIRMAWDTRMQGFYLFITPLDGSAATHYLWESRTGSWFPFAFATAAHNPRAVCVLDGDSPADRVVLLGGQDGYVRQFDVNATTDDSVAFTSTVTFGPYLAPSMGELLMTEIQPELGVSSGSVTYAVYAGRTAEEALSNSPVTSGTWTANRNNTTFVRRAGYAIYIKVSGTSRWTMERIRIQAKDLDRVRGRGRVY